METCSLSDCLEISTSAERSNTYFLNGVGNDELANVEITLVLMSINLFGSFSNY